MHDGVFLHQAQPAAVGGGVEVGIGIYIYKYVGMLETKSNKTVGQNVCDEIFLRAHSYISNDRYWCLQVRSLRPVQCFNWLFPIMVQTIQLFQLIQGPVRLPYHICLLPMYTINEMD